MEIVIPTHKRHDRVHATQAFEGAILCVEDSQVDIYREYNPGVEIVSHPDSIKGLSNKRQWIYEKFGDVFMVDDDVTAMRRCYVSNDDDLPLGIDAKTATELVRMIYENACAIDAKLFGVAKNAHPRNYVDLEPIRLTGTLNGCALGIRKSPYLRFPDSFECTAVEDTYISLLNAHYHRIAYIDMRFGVSQQDTFKNKGGQAEFRNIESEKRDFEFLVRNFGDNVVQLRGDNTHKMKAMHQWQRKVQIPF